LLSKLKIKELFIINKTFQIGRLVRDSELTYSPSGVAICKFTIAVDRTFKDKDGNKQADFLPVVTFNKLAELCAQYLSKGKLCAVDGRIQTGSYDHKDGHKVYTTDIIGENIQFLSPKDDGQGQQQRTTSSLGHEVNLDDDIPF